MTDYYSVEQILNGNLKWKWNELLLLSIPNSWWPLSFFSSNLTVYQSSPSKGQGTQLKSSFDFQTTWPCCFLLAIIKYYSFTVSPNLENSPEI